MGPELFALLSPVAVHAPAMQSPSGDIAPVSSYQATDPVETGGADAADWWRYDGCRPRITLIWHSAE